jgi:hypothetical protein
MTTTEKNTKRQLRSVLANYTTYPSGENMRLTDTQRHERNDVLRQTAIDAGTLPDYQRTVLSYLFHCNHEDQADMDRTVDALQRAYPHWFRL